MQRMAESVSKEFAQSKNGLLHHGLTGLTGQLSCPPSGLLQRFSEANRQPPGDRDSWYIVTTRYSLYSLYSYFSWGAERFERGLPVVHAPSTHPERHGLGTIPYMCRIEPLLLTSGIHPQGGFECSPHPIFCWHCDLSFPRHTILCDF